MRWIKQLSGTLLLVGLFGCTVTGNKLVENLASLPPDKGLVIFSTGADKSNLTSSTGLTLIEGGSRKKYDKVVINIDAPFASHFADEHGHVRSLALPAGDYFFVPYSGNAFLVVTEAPVFKFTVTKNQVSYIGNFHVSGNVLSWSDSKRDRDLDFFLKKNPAMAKTPIEPQRAEAVSKVSKFEINGTLWEVP